MTARSDGYELEGIEEFFENASIGLHWVAPDGTILRANRCELELLGYERAEYEGRHIADFHVDAPAIEDILRRLLAGETLNDYPARMRAKDGSVKHVLINSNMRRGPDGSFVHTRCFTRDITDRVAMEEQLRRTNEDLERRVAERTEQLAQANRELEQFAFAAAHDLKEPLRQVAGHAELLRRRYMGRLGDDADAFINALVDGTRRMADLIDDLLAYARAGADSPLDDDVALDSVIDEALANLDAAIAASDAQIRRDTPLPHVRGSTRPLVQLFQNLLGNALKFNDKARPEIHVSASEARGDVHVSVSDNGKGFAPEEAETIFEIFHRGTDNGQSPGTGVGLALCRRIAERHDGHITAESRPGEGATFRVTLKAPTIAAAGADRAATGWRTGG